MTTDVKHICITKLEQKIVNVLSLPYSDELIYFRSGSFSESYPLHGCDIKRLASVIYGSLELGRYVSPAHQVALSRALSSLHKKRLIGRLKPVRDWTCRSNARYEVDARLINHEAIVTRYPHNTKIWWVLVSDLREASL